MMKLNLTKKQKILALLALGALFIFSAEKVFFSSISSKLRSMNRQIKAAETTLQRNLAIRQSKDLYSAEFKAYQAYLKEEKSDLGGMAVDFLKEVERLARESGVSVINLNPQAAVENIKGSRIYKADLRLEASSAQLLGFFVKVQESRLLINLERFSISPKDEQATTLKADAVVSLAIP
jgi:hypothetical protein